MNDTGRPFAELTQLVASRGIVHADSAYPEAVAADDHYPRDIVAALLPLMLSLQGHRQPQVAAGRQVSGAQTQGLACQHFSVAKLFAALTHRHSTGSVAQLR